MKNSLFIFFDKIIDRISIDIQYFLKTCINFISILVDKIHSMYDRISINIRYYFITCIFFRIDKRFKNL